jgi:hypothetical protein
MNNHFINNREFIKNLSVNTGTTSAPVFTSMCTASELNFNTEFEEKTFYVFCDAIQRAIKTGVAMTIEGTVKIDMNNAAIISLLGDIHTLISTGEIAQFSNQIMQFDLLTDIDNSVLEYTTYQVPVSFSLSDLGGAAEDEGDFSITINITGKGTVVTSA